MHEPKARRLSLTEVAERLGVHYMTVYRYVRTGKLPARREGGQWWVSASDLDRLAQEPAAPRRRGAPHWAQHTKRLCDRLVSGDEPGAWQLVERALAGGAEPTEIYVRALGPALRQVGDRWAQGTLEVAGEHRATAVAARLIGRLGPRFARRGRHRGTIVLGAAPGDSHALPAAMLADVMRGQGYLVVDLGGSTPIESFASATAEADTLRAVGISAATTEGLDSATDAIRELRPRLAGIPILLGGPAVGAESLAREAGADGWAGDAAEAIAVLEGLIRRRL